MEHDDEMENIKWMWAITLSITPTGFIEIFVLLPQFKIQHGWSLRRFWRIERI
jgi:hypothetical protein